MKPTEILKQAEITGFVDQKGKRTRPKFSAPMNAKRLAELEEYLPCLMPADIRELLCYCSSFTTPFAGDIMDDVFFRPSGIDLSPQCVDIASDICGNTWIIDLTPDSASFGPVFYSCHDPPVFIYQSESLSHFLQEVLKLGNAPWRSEISVVHEEYAGKIWRDNPGLINYDQCINSEDADLKAFAATLDASYLFADLRQPAIGDGFSWGRFGADTVTKRFGNKRVFAIQSRELGWVQKIFGV